MWIYDNIHVGYVWSYILGAITMLTQLHLPPPYYLIIEATLFNSLHML